MKLLTFVILFSMFAPVAKADKATECMRLWALEKEMGCPVPDDLYNYGHREKRENFIVTSEFGPSKCAIDENLEKQKVTLKTECSDWLKERKNDLGTNFLTGTCNSSCSPCEKNDVLQHCTVKGEVHYSVK